MVVYIEIDKTYKMTVEDREERFGEIAKRKGYITWPQLLDALEVQVEETIEGEVRFILVTKGCCEACVVPTGVCKAIHVAANLALPRDISMKIVKKG